jgi:membrane protease YdiL (CAAX protease family)
MERSRFIEHWGELQRVAWLFGLLLATSFVFGIGWRWTHSPWLEVIQAGVQAVIVVVAVLQRYPKLAFLFQPRPTGPREALAMVGIAVLFVVLGTAYFWLLGELGVPLLSSTDSFRRAGWPLWATFLLVSLMPAVFEELAFRGVIQSSLERVFGARDAWLIQAALFSVLHLSPLIFPSHFLMGLCFGYMRRRSRSIYPGMLLHACWNALVVIKEL